MNSNFNILEETNKSPILNTENEPDVKTEESSSTDGKKVTENKDTGLKKSQEQMVKEPAHKTAESEKKSVLEETGSLEKKDNNLVRITYNLTYDLNEKFNSFTKQYELYKTSLIKALMEGWLDGSIEFDENEVLFNDGLIKIKKKAGSRKAVGSILVSAELDNAFTKKCHETAIEKNNCIFRLLKKYLEQKMPNGKL
jgi:hypothetical protein